LAELSRYCSLANSGLIPGSFQRTGDYLSRLR
jgi:hypothetical protein